MAQKISKGRAKRKDHKKSKKPAASKKSKTSSISDLSVVKKEELTKDHRAKTYILFCCVTVVMFSALTYGYCFREMDKVESDLTTPPRVAFYQQ